MLNSLENNEYMYFDNNSNTNHKGKKDRQT